MYTRALYPVGSCPFPRVCCVDSAFSFMYEESRLTAVPCRVHTHRVTSNPIKPDCNTLRVTLLLSGPRDKMIVRGLHRAKRAIESPSRLKEAVVLPIKYPQLFTGKRQPFTVRRAPGNPLSQKPSVKFLEKLVRNSTGILLYGLLI